MKIKSQKGSITIFVLIALLFYTAFLLLMYTANTNKLVAIKEKSDILKGVYEQNIDDDSINNIYNKKMAEYNSNFSNFQMVEYLESTGSQYIDTRLLATDYPDMSVEIKGNYTSIPTNSYQFIFGSNANNGPWIFIGFFKSRNSFLAQCRKFWKRKSFKNHRC